MTKPTETQSKILNAAAQRPENLAMPLPKGLHGAVAKTVVTKMIKSGWLQEVDANMRRNEPLWRETGDGHGTTLIATEAGLEAIGIEPVVASTMTNLRKAKRELVTGPNDAPKASLSSVTPKPVANRPGTKQAEIIALIHRPEGASIAEIVEATGWLAHSARGLISGGLKKKLNLPITSEKVTGRGTVYKIEAV
tara:strand:+ start:337 stop:918 length:582 start_codon:yes stop_codon:yes gene_type:complete